MDYRHNQITVGRSQVHVVEAGDAGAEPFLFLHGWPESWQSWQQVMTHAATDGARAVAIDLPGIGESSGWATDGSKRELADVVQQLVAAMGLRNVTLVGQDVGGMIAYSYLRQHRDIARAVIMDVVIPGLDPWDEVLHNPYIWHFALHAVPDLPEVLVAGRQERYFAYFYDVLSHDPARITAAARTAYAQAYGTAEALTAGFNWYRSFDRDAKDNRASAHGDPVPTPLLYIRGEHEGGDIARYVRAFKDAGVPHVRQAIVPGAGHFTQEESPEQTWRLIAAFARNV